MPEPLDLDEAFPCRCPDCGEELMPPESLALEPARIRAALKDRRLVVPDEVYRALDRLDRELRCRLGLCRASSR